MDCQFVGQTSGSPVKALWLRLIRDCHAFLLVLSYSSAQSLMKASRAEGGASTSKGVDKPGQHRHHHILTAALIMPLSQTGCCGASLI